MRAGQNPLDEGGLVALIASPEQQIVLRQIQGMMSLLEGHGDITMNRAGSGLIPSADRFQRVLHERRRQGGPTRIFQRLLGIEAKLLQYELGERFIEAIEGEGGRELFDRVWESPENLPTLAEIREPETWMSRVRAEAPAAQ
jgi:putative hydrolase